MSSRANSLTIRAEPTSDRARSGSRPAIATKQEPSDYGLIATRHEQEGGVFRVDYRTGALSVCYLYFQREKQGDHEAIADQYVVCTPQWNQPAPARQSGAVGQAPEAGGGAAHD